MDSDGKKSACNARDLGTLSWEDSPEGGRGHPLQYSWTPLVAQKVKNLPAMQETWLRALGWEEDIVQLYLNLKQSILQV